MAPGSIFKPIVALAGLESGAIDAKFSVNCSGGATFYDRYFRCHRSDGHGRVSLYEALAESCDVYFYHVGNRIGIDKIAEFAELVGFGSKTGIDLPGEAAGLVPSTQWKARTFRQKWYAGETISVAIGQGALTVTPLQAAYAIGGLVQGGVWPQPHLARDRVGEDSPRVADFKVSHAIDIVDGLCAVVNDGGTGVRAHLPGIDVCGKTGTSQLVSSAASRASGLSNDFKDNAWFVGFAPRRNPEIVVVALFEAGEHGNLAAPIVRDVMKAYFDKKTRKTNSQSLLALAEESPDGRAEAKRMQ